MEPMRSPWVTSLYFHSATALITRNDFQWYWIPHHSQGYPSHLANMGFVVALSRILPYNPPHPSSQRRTIAQLYVSAITAH